MKSAARRLWSVVVAAAVFSPMAWAVPVEVDMTNLRAIQTYDLGKGDDQAYLLVNGVAQGKEFMQKVPADKTYTVGPKKPVASVKEPVALWKGDLNDGEFAYLTVTLMQGSKPDDAKTKELQEKLSAAEKKAAGRDAAKGTKESVEKLAAETLKAEVEVIKDVKKVLSREAKTDHYGGLFNVLVWNNGGTIVKRVDPVGLTFGEHYGVDPKIYTKIKNTRPNVMMQDEATKEWAEQQVTPLSDELDAVRVKGLEAELVKPAAGGEPEKHVTDYLVELQVKADGKPLKWKLGGEQTGPDDLHVYWDFAE